MKLFFIRKFSKNHIRICNFLNNFNSIKTMNQKTLVLLLTVVKISMGHEIYVTDFIVEFKKRGGG